MIKKLKFLFLLLFIVFALGNIRYPQEVHAANVITHRISEVRKIYPHGSRLNKTVLGTTMVRKNGKTYCHSVYNGGCNSLVTFLTMKVFHNPYVPHTTSYKNIGTASTYSTSSMKKLFKKAKVGDVVRMYNGKGECHFAIFLSKTGNGIKLYESNFGSKNKVWYNHLWKWGKIKSWSQGATKISVLRSFNYNQVASGKAAKKYIKGTRFTINGITYQVTKNSLNCGQVKVIQKATNAGKMPKAIGINKDTASYLRKKGSHDFFATYMSGSMEYRVYYKKPAFIQDEQYFTVK